jgi:sugar lactone lactonase YvrE
MECLSNPTHWLYGLQTHLIIESSSGRLHRLVLLFVNNPNGLFVDTTASNTLYVADTGNHRIQKWLPGATSGITVAGQSGVPGNGLNQLNSPTTLIVDTSGNMFISDNRNNRIMRWSAGSNYGLLIAGSTTSGASAYQLWNPLGIHFDSSGSLYVADCLNSRIQQFSISCRQ